MSIERLKSALPDYAKDLKLNLGNVLATPGMTPTQIWGTAVAAAVATRNPLVIRAAKAAAAIMGMNNIYYRFTHLASAKEYGEMPAKLRMNIIASHGVDPVDFELWSLAVSAINGCAVCIDSHERTVLKKGVTRETVQNVVRIAAVLNGVAFALEAESSLSEEQLEQGEHYAKVTW
jgi:alkyl hydroperoxide reductase subunit D